MKKVTIRLFLLVLLFAATSSLVNAGSWSDRFPKPEAISPGAAVSPGQVLTTLTPELKFHLVGDINYVEIIDTQDDKLTLSEQLSNRRVPVLSAQVYSDVLQIPVGILRPGKTYYWKVLSIHAPGSKSEATTTSARLYFSTSIVSR